jgi:hypothetical protein
MDREGTENKDSEKATRVAGGFFESFDIQAIRRPHSA